MERRKVGKVLKNEKKILREEREGAEEEGEGSVRGRRFEEAEVSLVGRAGYQPKGRPVGFARTVPVLVPTGARPRNALRV